MFVFKLIDVIIQGVALLNALLLLIVFQASGYFYWITLGLMIWIVISSIIDLFTNKEKMVLRKIVLIFLGALLLLFAFLYFTSTLGILNFYFRTLSVIVICIYLLTSILELNSLQKSGKESLDF